MGKRVKIREQDKEKNRIMKERKNGINQIKTRMKVR